MTKRYSSGVIPVRLVHPRHELDLRTEITRPAYRCAYVGTGFRRLLRTSYSKAKAAVRMLRPTSSSKLRKEAVRLVAIHNANLQAIITPALEHAHQTGAPPNWLRTALFHYESGRLYMEATEEERQKEWMRHIHLNSVRCNLVSVFASL